MTKEIIENNKLILKLFPRNGSQDSSSDFGENILDWYAKKLKYHSSWEWLIPVVEKIEKMGLYQFIIKPQ